MFLGRNTPQHDFSILVQPVRDVSFQLELSTKYLTLCMIPVTTICLSQEILKVSLSNKHVHTISLKFVLQKNYEAELPT